MESSSLTPSLTHSREVGIMLIVAFLAMTGTGTGSGAGVKGTPPPPPMSLSLGAGGGGGGLGGLGSWAWKTLAAPIGSQATVAKQKPLDLRPVTRLPTFRVHGPNRRFQDVLGSKEPGKTASRIAQLIEEYLPSPEQGQDAHTENASVRPPPGPSVTVDTVEELRGLLEGGETRSSVSVVAFGARWCRLCKVLQPGIEALHGKYAPLGVALITVDVDVVGTLKPGRTGLLPAPEVAATEDENLIESCSACSGTGFVPCSECSGRGAVEREGQVEEGMVVKMTVTCPGCVGYTRLRCPTCGGRCLMCE